MLVGRSEKPSKSRHSINQDYRGREIAFKAVPRFIPLAIKLGFVYLGFKLKVKKAGKIFKKELIANGIDKNTAKLLTEEYLKGSHFFRRFNFS
jgi:hypothetical protein